MVGPLVVAPTASPAIRRNAATTFSRRLSARTRGPCGMDCAPAMSGCSRAHARLSRRVSFSSSNGHVAAFIPPHQSMVQTDMCISRLSRSSRRLSRRLAASLAAAPPALCRLHAHLTLISRHPHPLPQALTPSLATAPRSIAPTSPLRARRDDMPSVPAFSHMAFIHITPVHRRPLTATSFRAAVQSRRHPFSVSPSRTRAPRPISLCATPQDQLGVLASTAPSNDIPPLIATQFSSPSPSPSPSSPPPSPAPFPSPSPPSPPIRLNRLLLGGYYIAFITYATFFVSGSFFDSMELQKLYALDFAHMNNAFFAIFSLMFPIGLNYAVALNPASSRQKRLPDKPFTLAGLLFGFFAIGPYLIARNYAPSVPRRDVQQRGVLSRLLESRLFSFGSAAMSLLLYFRVFGAFAKGGELMHDMMFYSSFVELTRMFGSDRFVTVTCMDFLTLSLFMWGPLTEDMRRRGWFIPGTTTESLLTAATIVAIPGFGPALYFILRPELPESTPPTSHPPSSSLQQDDDDDDK